MEITHRISFGKLDKMDSLLDSMKVKYRKTAGLHGYYLITFDMNESDPRWPEIRNLA